MRHLYASNEQEAIELAKTFERRRCNHHTLDEPLSELECLTSVVDPKGSGTNKNRYIVACQLAPVRVHMRGVLGVPLVYVKKSVMIMEPMAEKTGEERVKDERSKFRLGLKMRTGARTILGKRGREDEDGGQVNKHSGDQNGQGDEDSKKKKRKGPKGPNPMSIKKPKKREDHQSTQDATKSESTVSQQHPGQTDTSAEKRKRKRKSSSKTEEAGVVEVDE
jgi:U3 small nucleolar RNA-associated protein 23